MDKALIKRMVVEEIKGLSYEEALQKFGPFFENVGGKARLKAELRKGVKVVLTGGVFDCLHIGHIRTLRKAKEYGDVLVVVVARDELVERRKGKAPLQKASERREVVASLSFVDVAIEGAKDFNETIERVRPDVVVFGYDQEPFPVKGAEIVKLKEEKEGVKSSSIKQRMDI